MATTILPIDEVTEALIAQWGVIGELARAHGKTPGQITLRWLIQNRIIAIPRTSKESRARENFDIFDFELDDRQIQEISALDKGEAGRQGPNPDTFDWIPA